MTLVIRAAADSAALTAAVRAAIASVDPDQPPFAIAPMRRLMEDSVPLRRPTLVGRALFSSLALVLAAIGLRRRRAPPAGRGRLRLLRPGAAAPCASIP
jgi:putative ABC transport system permease protein